MAMFRGALVASMLFSGGAMAGTFGPATASLGSFDTPTVVLTGGVDSVTLNGGADQLSSGTGSLGSTPYIGSGAGTLNFTEVPGATTLDVINGLFSFGDKHGGTFVYDLTSVTTVSFSSAPGVSTSFALYLLGTMREDNADPTYQLDANATSITMTFNQDGNSAYSESGSLATPPVGLPVVDVPEPASMALLGAGLVGMALVRRRAS